ncbi:MAG: hypothetical protein NVS1B7_7480 [Candidatus Saccharimonadales bacterium]
MPYSHANRSSRGPARQTSFNRGASPRRNNRRRNSGASLDYRRFIQKARAIETTADYIPAYQFTEFGFGPELTANLVNRGYITPTPIQDQAIPYAMDGKDVLGIANTGTGKTAAFLLPLIEHVLANPQTATIMIIAPVRELAQQIEAELAIFARGLKVSYMTAIGGTPIGPQLRQLDMTPHFIIGTPGRIIDLMERDALPLKHVSAVVLDEVDRMLDMGFVDSVRQIMAALPAKRQSLFFSATVSGEVTNLIRSFMQDPITITVKTQETSDNVEQDVVRIGYGMDKIEVLHELLNQPAFGKVLVFGETKFGVERLANNLTARGFKAEAIHGNKSQSQRSRAIKNFTGGHANVLVATDVAARGLDIKGITHVINFDLPQTYDDYTHRIGRTGRGGELGYALTFIEG